MRTAHFNVFQNWSRFPFGRTQSRHRDGGFDMKSFPRLISLLPAFGLLLVALNAEAQSFRVQCPSFTTQHDGVSNDTPLGHDRLCSLQQVPTPKLSRTPRLLQPDAVEDWVVRESRPALVCFQAPVVQPPM